MKLFLLKNKYLILIILLIFLSFGPSLYQKTVPGTNDVSIYIIKKMFLAENLKKGIFPLWDNLRTCGFPVIEATTYAVFYPLNILWFLFEYKFAMTLFYIIHFIFAGWTMYYLLNKILDLTKFSSFAGTLNFLFSGIFLIKIWTGHAHLFTVISFLPVILILSYKYESRQKFRYPLITGLIIALQIFAGRAEGPVISFLMLFIIALFDFLLLHKKKGYIKNRILFLLISLIATIVISSPQIIPSYLISKNTARIQTYNFSTFSSVPFQNLVTLLLPDFFGNYLTADYWGITNYFEMFIYCGCTALLLSIFFLIYRIRNSRVLVFTLSGLFFLLLAMGKYTPLYSVLYYLFPVIRVIRTPARFACIFQLCFSINTALIIQDIIDNKISAKKIRLFLYSLFTLVLFLFCLIIFKPAIISYVKNNISQFQNISILTKTLNDSYITIYRGFPRLLFIIAGLIILFSIYNKFNNKTLLKLIIIIVLFADTFLWSKKFMYLYYEMENIANDKICKYIKNDLNLKNSRILSNEQNIRQIKYDYFNIPTITGYTNLVTTDYADFIHIGIENNLNYKKNFESQWFFFMPLKNLNSPLISLMDCKYFILENKLKSVNLKYITELNGKYIYENINNKGHIIFYNNYRVVDKNDDIFRILNKEDTSIFDTALMVKEPVFYPENTLTEKTEFNNSYNYKIINPNKKQITVSLKQDSIIMISDYYYKNWKFFINNDIIPSYRVNGIFTGICLKKGKYDIKMKYSFSFIH